MPTALCLQAPLPLTTEKPPHGSQPGSQLSGFCPSALSPEVADVVS